MVVDASIEASQVELFALTGKPVIGVFQTLSAGNAGHAVPGRTVPKLAAVARVPAWKVDLEIDRLRLTAPRGVATAVPIAMLTTKPAVTRSGTNLILRAILFISSRWVPYRLVVQQRFTNSATRCQLQKLDRPHN
jgi:hypothetical protein